MEPKYHFTHLKNKSFHILQNKSASDYFKKWSITGSLKLTTFSFNEQFKPYEKNDFVESFFKDAVVMSVLNEIKPSWNYNKEMIEKIELEEIPCTVTSLSFFDRLLEEDNNIVRSEGSIRQCYDDFIDDFIVADELRKLIIDEESDNYGLFNEKDRDEFIFRIFKFLVLGGKWCQYEDKINPYLDLTKILYKDLVRVERNIETKEIEIRSFILKVKLIDKQTFSIFPVDGDHVQNFAYLIIDSLLRQVTLFVHEFGGEF